MDDINLETGWRFKIHEKTITEFVNLYRQNRPFVKNLVHMFDYLMRASRLLWNRENAIHIFFNYNSAYKEIHFRKLPCNSCNPNDSEDFIYSRKELNSFKEIQEMAKILRGNINRFYENKQNQHNVRILSYTETKFLCEFDVFNNIVENINNFNKTSPVVLIMDDGEVNLGSIILYGNDKKEQTSKPFSDDPSSDSAVVNWARAFSHFFKEQVAVTRETYLPSYRCRHSSKAAILFGDITNFTQLATMLRIIDTSYIEVGPKTKVEELGKIMREHCDEMSKIVDTYQGRIERFMGDGLMAIFGEHQEDPIIAVGNAVAAASNMVKTVRRHRDKINDMIYGKDGQHEVNEMVEIDFSVGINYGTVLFDYLGDEKHIEYSCLGDHVAFANRLMHKAARYDPEIQKKMSPILISQTAEQHLKFWIGKIRWDEYQKNGKQILYAKGYGYPSYVYGLETDTFDMDKYENMIKFIKDRSKTEEEVVKDIKDSFLK